MSRKFTKPTQKAPEPKVEPEVKPVLDLGVLDEPKVEVANPDAFDYNRYKVTAEGGLLLRSDMPTSASSTVGTGAIVGCMSFGDVFVEEKRVGNWSYGNYMGKSGWACNKYLTK